MAIFSKTHETIGLESPMYKRHRSLSYQGYSFPWFITLIWIGFFICGIGYLVRFLLLT